jgi:hypothetical protein
MCGVLESRECKALISNALAFYNTLRSQSVSSEELAPLRVSIEHQSAMTIRAFLVEDSPALIASVTEALEELAPVVVVGNALGEKAALVWMVANPGGCDLLIVDLFLNQGSDLGVLRAAQGPVRPKGHAPFPASVPRESGSPWACGIPRDRAEQGPPLAGTGIRDETFRPVDCPGAAGSGVTTNFH